MTGHVHAWVEPVDADRWWLHRSCCECGWRSAVFDVRLPRGGRPAETWHAWHAVQARAEEAAERAAFEHAEHRAWWGRAGHCGACGQPGDWCLCRVPCGCADLHPVGSGLGRDAVDLFAMPADDGQGELFG